MLYEPIQGGCQCGAVRYTLTAPPSNVFHCHCSMCRKAHGALFASEGLYDLVALTIDRGADAVRDYQSSPGNHREFCGQCGGRLFNRMDDWPDNGFVVLGSLDAGAQPGHDRAKERHIFWGSRAAWYNVGDDLHKDDELGDPP